MPIIGIVAEFICSAIEMGERINFGFARFFIDVAVSILRNANQVMTLDEIYESIDAEAIDAFVAEGQEEHLSLEFKVANTSDLGNRDDRKNLAKALSGFSNSSGGIIVWGIEARRDDTTGIDQATDKQEIPNVNLFVSKLNEYTGQAVSPIVDGVLHKAILVNDDAGFAVTLVPESYSGPHMAKLGEDRYYKRSGDSFYKMEHFDLEDMFGRRKRPKLIVTAAFAGIQPRQRENRINIRALITIHNEGRGSAKSPFLEIQLSDSMREADYVKRGLNYIFHSSSGRVLRYGSSSDIVIHPGVSLDVTTIEKRYRYQGFEMDEYLIRYKVTAEGVALESGEIVMDTEEINDRVQSRINR